jgi:hypothetical protein
MKNARVTMAVVVVLGSTAALALAARPSHGDEDGPGEAFSARTIKGDWGFVGSVGRLLPPTVPKEVSTTGLGRIHFDGEGGCSVSSIVNVDGQTMTLHSSTCRYTVNADGTGTSEAVFPTSPIAEPLPVAFVIVQKGREIMFENTRFIIGTFLAHRQ